jgi:hypothetical protein
MQKCKIVNDNNILNKKISELNAKMLEFDENLFNINIIF